MRRFWPLALFLVIAIIIAISLYASPAPKIAHSDKLNPQRIITLAPSITEIAFALGLGNNIIAVSDYCDYPHQATTLPNVGSYLALNLEAIAALQPDLVILANQPHLVTQLQQLNINTLVVEILSLDDIKTTISSIANRTSRQERAQQLLSQMEQEITTIVEKTQGLPKPKVMLSMGHSLADEQIKTIFIAGQKDFYNDLIKLAGGENVYQDNMVKVPSLTLEGIIALNPEVIIDIFPEADDHNADIKKIRAQWKKLDHIDAVKHNRVHIIEQNYATIPGPRIVLLLEQLAHILHPEINWTQSPL